ncbi:hypothetical protein LCGC14_1372130 [marine sediment metagenome]|uniref:Glycosyltransferase 2-like domain-containing protein n=1 Tax=marine sediment metagenome TaxID=412755 RepID=A0A0F9N730_9ZZZZ
MSYPKIAGVTRIRNEAHIIQDTLDHYGEFCPARIYVLDEASTDDTAEIVRTHPDVRQLIEVPTFEADPGKRRAFEGWGRQDPCDQAVAAGAEWILCFDADERIEFDFESFDYANWDAVSFRLFDFYITAEDIDGWDNTAGPHPWVTYPWSTREWIGPEYRDIQMLFRVGNDVPKFYDRVPEMQPSCRVFEAGYDGCVRHYGKAISIEEWERTCDYYANYQPEPFSSKWAARRGHAIHYMSDFGHPLCRWEDREKYGIPLVTEEGMIN